MAVGRPPVCSRPMTLVVDHLAKRFGTVVALDDLAFEVPPRPGVRLPRRERRGQDDDDADRARRPRARTPAGSPGAAPSSHQLPRSTWGYLPEERGLYPRMKVLDQLRVLRRAARRARATSRRREAMAWLAPVPGRGPRRPPGRAAVEGQPAEGPVHRRDPARPAGPAHGRAVHRPRPGQRGAPARGVPRAPRPRPDRRLLDPPDGGRRGAVRVGRDRRPRADGRRRPAPRGQAVDRPADGPDRRSTATTGCRGWPPCPATRVHPGRAWTARGSSSTPAWSPTRVLAAAIGAGARVRHFELADPSLEQVFIDLVGRPGRRGGPPRAGDPATRRPGRRQARRGATREPAADRKATA